MLLTIDDTHQLKKTTDADGHVTFKVDPGIYIAYVFKDGYRPVTATVVSGVGAAENLVLVKNQQFVVGEVTVKRLTLTEILAAGIDITAPENQHIYQFEAHIQLDLSTAVRRRIPPPTKLYFTAAGTPVVPGGGSGPSTGLQRRVRLLLRLRPAAAAASTSSRCPAPRTRSRSPTS